jgi:tetratricopeptide (TPR) repeat protein
LLGERAIRVQLAAALDDWAMTRKAAGKKGWKRLLAAARVADPDQWRNRLRDALQRNDRKALLELGCSALVKELPPLTLFLLGHALRAHGASEASVSLLRKAQRRFRGDFWINQELAMALRELKPPRSSEAVRFFMASVAIRPQSPGSHLNLGVVLYDKGDWDEAIACFKEALRLKPDYAEAHNDLGNVYTRLGMVSKDQGKLAKAVAAYRLAIKLKPDYAEAHGNLGIALHHQGKLPEAVRAYRQGIKQGIKLKPDKIAKYNSNLGLTLEAQGKLAEAEVAYRRAIKLQPDYPQAYCNMGNVLRRQGRLAESLAALKRGHKLGSRKPGWPYPSDQWVREGEALVKLDLKLPAVLAGKAKPTDIAETGLMAWLCRQPFKRLYAASACFYAEAFQAEPKQVENLKAGYRYNAACAAGLAGCGQGKDANLLDAKERACLRRQALDWLRADLAAWRRLLEKRPAKARPAVVQKMTHWQRDPDLAGVRNPEALAQLPAVERQLWQKLWQDVATLRDRAAKGR